MDVCLCFSLSRWLTLRLPPQVSAHSPPASSLPEPSSPFGNSSILCVFQCVCAHSRGLQVVFFIDVCLSVWFTVQHSEQKIGRQCTPSVDSRLVKGGSVCVCVRENIAFKQTWPLPLCPNCQTGKQMATKATSPWSHTHTYKHTPYTYITIQHFPTSNELHYATLLHWTLVLDAGCLIQHIVLSQMRVRARFLWGCGFFFCYLATPPHPCDVAGLPQLAAPQPLHAGIGSPLNLENVIPQKLLNDCVLVVHFCVSYRVGCLNTHTDISIFL